MVAITAVTALDFWAAVTAVLVLVGWLVAIDVVRQAFQASPIVVIVFAAMAASAVVTARGLRGAYRGSGAAR
jgi:hypothetical protein